MGMDLPELKGKSFEEYTWCGGGWAKFQHGGPHNLIWQTISRIYAGWVIPRNVQLQNNAIVQVYLDNPSTTPEAALRTNLFFPLA